MQGRFKMDQRCHFRQIKKSLVNICIPLCPFCQTTCNLFFFFSLRQWLLVFCDHLPLCYVQQLSLNHTSLWYHMIAALCEAYWCRREIERKTACISLVKKQDFIFFFLAHLVLRCLYANVCVWYLYYFAVLIGYLKSCIHKSKAQHVHLGEVWGHIPDRLTQ